MPLNENDLPYLIDLEYFENISTGIFERDCKKAQPHITFSYAKCPKRSKQMKTYVAST
jgi:hypothetical protein